jgi:hypothetical protein
LLQPDVLPQEDESPLKTPSALPETRAVQREPKPALGVYQHHNVQLDDFTRLVDSLKIMPSVANDQRDTSAFHALRINKENSPEATNSMAQRRSGNGASYANLVNTLRSSILSPSSEPIPHTTPDSNGTTLGPGVDIGGRNFVQETIATSGFPPSQSSHLQDLSQLQHSQIQLPYTTPEQTLRILQAAVLAQDHFMGSMNSSSAFEASLPSAEPKTPSNRQWKGIEDGSRAAFSSVGPLQRLDARTAINPVSTTDQSQPFNKLSHHRIHRPGIKIPAPILPGLDFGRSGSGLLDSGNGPSGQVPTLLPALSPTSPLLSSEEPSPVTPNFQHLTRGFDAEEEVNQA